jgi:hypothetical protein
MEWLMERFRFVLSWLLLVNILGCAGIQYTDRMQAVDITEYDKQQTTIKVLAKAEEWRNSGVIVEKGKKYAIKAKGKWTHQSLVCSWIGPDGITGCPSLGGVIVEGWSGAALIGKINENGTPFAVGNELVLSPQEKGILYLRINDAPGLCGDNAGYVDVDIALADKSEDHFAKSEAKPPAFETKEKYVSDKKDARQYVQGQKWAVVIGISKYQDSRIPGLRYASADAHSFYEWLISRKGGGYAPSRVILLLDSEATGKNIKNALFNWLKQALEEDMVTIYFAGHGSSESPDSPNNLYLLPFDSVYDNVATTGFPM